MDDHEPSTNGGCGDPGLSPDVREALALLRTHSKNDDFRTLVDDVLAGRRSLLEASGTAAFSAVVFAGIAQQFNKLTEDDRRRLAAAAEPSQDTAAYCATPCSGCSRICALRGDPCS